MPLQSLNLLKGVPVCTTKGEHTRESNFVTDIGDGLMKEGLRPTVNWFQDHLREIGEIP